MFAISLNSFAGCASPLKQEEKSAEYGEYPGNCSEIVRSHYQAIARDPNSIRFNAVHVPGSFSFSDGFRHEKFGSIIGADLNFKASSGEYTGHRADGLLVNNGRIVCFIGAGQRLGKNVC